MVSRNALPPDGETVQTATVAATAFVFGASAVFLGLKKEPEPCPACAQSGGEACIFCDATGRRENPIKVTKGELRDDIVLGLTRRNPLECTVCKGAGMILCKTCRGNGFV